MENAKIAVFGDFCLDAYWDIDEESSELSLETGLPVRRVKTQRYSLGGAGCVPDSDGGWLRARGRTGRR